MTRLVALVVAVGMISTGCFRGRGGFRLLEAAVVTAVIVSSIQPPPPRVVVVETRPGYVWQAGYWTRQGDQWVWMDGAYVQERPNYQWSPAHWEQGNDGAWRLIPGQWVEAQ